MRDASQGLFRDAEYWHHCELGGHPTPKGRIFLQDYESFRTPIEFLLPDAAHHLRRLWTSVSLTMPKLNLNAEAVSTELPDAISDWERVENQVVLSFDGIGAFE